MSYKREETYEKMHSRVLYNSGQEELVQEQLDALEILYDYNHSRPREIEKRREMLKKMFAEIGEGCYIEVPFYANWAGRHVHFGKNVYANFGLTMVDDTHIYVGDGVMIAPNVTIATATHPISPELRKNTLQYNLPVRIGNYCWIGSGAIILPGVTIGDNSVIGAGSVVTRDIPSNVVAVGNPCRVLREINENDRKYYYRDKEIDPSFFEKK
ncbi:MAG: sugar O-acetyltransferase [Clostridiales bacterium]|nr:sugar O-acetyltransferase [Clostridiales bacterium]